MAVSIVVGSNSWVTLAEANTYFESRIPSSAWDALTDEDKNKYLITAYNWLFYDPAFLAPASASETAVKYGQCEAAYFLIEYQSEFSKREALIASGVTEFDYSKWSEKLGEVLKPQTVINYFSNIGYYGAGDGFAYATTDETDV